MRWQRPMRFVLAGVGLACAAALVVYSHNRHRAVTPASRTVVDPKATSETSGVATIRFKSDKEELQIRAERSIKYEDGRTGMLAADLAIRDAKTFSPAAARRAA